MHSENDKIICHREITRIFKQISREEHRREAALYNRDVLNAVQELSGMKGLDLERLRGSTRASGVDGFFSIRHQLMITSIVVTVPVFLFFIVAWLL